MIKVLGIAPYPGLRDLLKELAAEVDGIDIEVEIADLDEALPLAQQAEERGYDVIISRGGTATLVRENVSLPVVDIAVSGYDILRVLTLIKDSNSKVVMIGFPNICQGAATVSSLLDFAIPILSISHESEVCSALQQAFENGAQLVLGDVVTVRTAQEMGYHGILVTSGRESVIDALSEAKHAYDLYRRGHEQVRFLERLLDHHPQGALVADGAGTIRYLNRAAANLFGEEAVQLVGQPLGSIAPDLGRWLAEAGQAGTQRVRLQKQTVQVEWVTIDVSERVEHLFYFQAIENDENGRFSEATKQERLATFAGMIGSSAALQTTITRAKSFAQVEQNVWIAGPFGSGRSWFAQTIHTGSARAAQGFHALVCQTADESELAAQLFGTEDSPGLLLSEPGTLYLADVDHLSAQLQAQLLHVLQNGTAARLIVSSTVPLAEMTASAFNQELAYLLGELYLPVPPLTERLEDIEEIARVLIAEHNSQYGKHIVGLRSEVLTRLRHHTWPGNVKELENVIGEMLLLTHDHYVGEQELAAVWERYGLSVSPTTSAGVGGPGAIDLTGSWEQIEKRILLHVLQEEEMNQSKAAKRLGLNRSTLWRKLRD